MRYLIKRQFVHLIAMMAILMGSLAPTISQAIVNNNTVTGFTAEICTTTGVKMTQAMGGTENADESKNIVNHCPYCVMHGAYDLPVNNTLTFAKPEAHQLHPQLFYQSPKPLFAWVSLPSRAPPSLV
jgi:hypothetical protein